MLYIKAYKYVKIVISRNIICLFFLFKAHDMLVIREEQEALFKTTLSLGVSFLYPYILGIKKTPQFGHI